MKDQQFRKMGAAKDIISTKVVRGGLQMLVPNTQVVTGDILILDTGDKVVADCIVIESFGLILDEASLTGEAEGIKKDRVADPWVRSGTQVCGAVHFSGVCMRRDEIDAKSGAKL